MERKPNTFSQHLETRMEERKFNVSSGIFSLDSPNLATTSVVQN